MKKNEYVAPEMEVVEIKGLCSILAGSDQDGTPGGKNDGDGDIIFPGG